MLNFQINGKNVLMNKFFTAQQTIETLKKVSELGAKTILLIDTPPTDHLSEFVGGLLADDRNVFLRDHHNIDDPKTERDCQIAMAADGLKRMLGQSAVISTREKNPACSSLMQAGEFKHVDLIIADADLDGLLGAMKALGTVYEALDSDASIFDGPRSGQNASSLSEIGWLLSRVMATLPPYDSNRPEISENAKALLFETFVSATQGDEKAIETLTTKVFVYEEGVAVAKKLLKHHTVEILPGVTKVLLGNVVKFDLATLTQGLEKVCKISVLEKFNGPIASIFGKQLSLCVTKADQETINLQDFLPSGFVSSPATGIISNTRFLLHVSEEIWEREVLPRLQERFGTPEVPQTASV